MIKDKELAQIILENNFSGVIQEDMYPEQRGFLGMPRFVTPLALGAGGAMVLSNPDASKALGQTLNAVGDQAGDMVDNAQVLANNVTA